MTEIHKLEGKIKEIIDQLKGLSTTHGLGNQAVEEEIITLNPLLNLIKE